MRMFIPFTTPDSGMDSQQILFRHMESRAALQQMASNIKINIATLQALEESIPPGIDSYTPLQKSLSASLSTN